MLAFCHSQLWARCSPLFGTLAAEGEGVARPSTVAVPHAALVVPAKSSIAAVGHVAAASVFVVAAAVGFRRSRRSDRGKQTVQLVAAVGQRPDNSGDLAAAKAPRDVPASRFLLARHGQTTFNVQNRFQGSMDVESVLTDKGIAQARELGEWVRDVAATERIQAVFVSPLLRARQTLAEVERMVDGLPGPHILSELREIDLYEWEGQTQQQVKQADPDSFLQWKKRPWELRLGRRRLVVEETWTRAAKAWQLMRSRLPRANDAETNGPALIVAHGTLGKALLGTALGLPITMFRHFNLKNGEVVEVAWPDERGGATAAAETGATATAVWRRRHPEGGPWRGKEDEEESANEDWTFEAA